MGLYCLSDASLTALGEGFTKLDKLSLLWCSNDCYVGDQGAAAIGKYCRQLEDLNLRFCKGLTDTGLIVLAIGCGKTLKSVGVAACAKLTNISLEAIGSHCRSLEKLSLDSEFINNKGILVVAKGCRLLKVLKLQCINVTNEALQAVGIFCLSLELLALYSFQRFTGKSLCAIGEGCKKLKKSYFK
ncbi:F-box/LRR-repeat protein 4 [Camellia lanceoleosa]|nr:F-box/LRR-repeat protein 4 [Camellia lanceoleosa]